jgi:hypothetical protein
MRSWPALLLAPLLALTDQSVAYALVTWSCKRLSLLLPHGVHLAFLLATVALTVLAWTEWRAMARAVQEDARVARPVFVAMVGTLAGAYSCLVILALWIPQWMLSPCVA